MTRRPEAIDWPRIYRWMGKTYHWASLDAVGRLTMAQLRQYLVDDEKEDEGDVVATMQTHGALMDYVRKYRRERGLPEEGDPDAVITYPEPQP